MENNEPLVSVIMCTYNTDSKYFFDAVSSILNQSYKNLELIIVDDCSSNKINIDLFEDKRLTLVRNDSNMGPSYSRNRAIKMSHGEYIAIMDADDISSQKRIEKQVEYLNSHPEVIVLGTWYRHIGEKTNDVKVDLSNFEYYRCCLFFGNYPTLLHPSCMIRASAFSDEHIYYDETLRFGEDYFLWVLLSERGVIQNLNETLFEYRIHSSQATDKNNRCKINYNISKIHTYLFGKMGLNIEQKQLIRFINFRSKYYDLKRNYKIILKLLDNNKIIKYYDQKEFVKRCDKQIKDCVNSFKNPLSLFLLIFDRRFSLDAREALSRKIRKLIGAKK